jgi:anti-sigma B factor antagonist
MSESPEALGADPPTVPHVAIAIAGELDLNTLEDLTVRISDAIAVAAQSVQIDLSGVTFVDSLCLGALVHAHNMCVAYGLSLELHSPSNSVRRLLDLTGTRTLFTVS